MNSTNKNKIDPGVKMNYDADEVSKCMYNMTKSSEIRLCDEKKVDLSNVKKEMYDTDEVLNFIRSTIRDNEVVLFMKGTKEAPQCGFSVKAAEILELAGIQFLAIDVMSMPGLREEMKKFTNWPTFPQLYYKERFIGGCDVIVDLHKKNLLKKELQ